MKVPMAETGRAQSTKDSSLLRSGIGQNIAKCALPAARNSAKVLISALLSHSTAFCSQASSNRKRVVT